MRAAAAGKPTHAAAKGAGAAPKKGYALDLESGGDATDAEFRRAS